MKNRYFVEISFLGSHYHGWQIQNGQITVQQVVNECICTMLQETINSIGCGRTDAGVHATKFFFHFDTEAELDTNFAYKLNAFLPQDIAVLNVYSLLKRIHARWDAISRTYEYHIIKSKNPFLNGFATVVHEMLDLDNMNKAAGMLMEYTDFETFSKTKNNHHQYLCTVTEAHWRQENEQLIFRITSNRFVRSMVRLIVGTLLMVGKDKLSLDDFRKIIESKDRSQTGMSVPAEGLYLVDVVYPEGVMVNQKIA